MSTKITPRLQEFFEGRTNGELRSIIEYNPDGANVVYLRDDVAEQYTDKEIETAIDEARMGSLHVPIYESTFSKDHGELVCMANCFENVIELNFALEDGVGTAVALDAEALDETHNLIADAHNITIEQRS